MSQIINLPLSLNLDITLPYLGLKGDGLSPELGKIIDHYLNETSRLSAPRGIWQTYNIAEKDADVISLEGSPLEIRGKSAVAHFLSSAKVTLLAVTLGKKLGDCLEELSLSKPSHALILDGIASAAVEQVAEEVDRLISRDIIRQGFFPTARFSPGYGQWPLSAQKELLQSLQGEKAGISLTPSYLLQPVKSVTAAIGWSTTPVPREYEYTPSIRPCQSPHTCSSCPLSKSCPALTQPGEQSHHAGRIESGKNLHKPS